MLTIRKRGEIYYIRGTVRVGTETVHVPEHSTGLADRASATSYRAKLQRDLEQEALHGTVAFHRQIDFDQAAIAYLANERHRSDITRVEQLQAGFRGRRLRDIDAAAFADFCRVHLPGRSANTLERVRVTLASIHKAAGVTMNDIPSYAEDLERIRWLSQAKSERLLRWYNKHAAPIALVARDCGLRASENILMTAGRCDPSWGAHGGFHVAAPKNGRDRIAPWTADARIAILPHLIGKRDSDRLWTGKRGPYRDTRQKGGNPLTKAHATACRDAGVNDFTWHDWRHHYATWALQPIEKGGFGWDILELAKCGGWEDLESVKRYSSVMLDGVSESMEKVGTRWAKPKPTLREVK